MEYFDIFDIDTISGDWARGERNLYANVLHLALRDALVSLSNINKKEL